METKKIGLSPELIIHPGETIADLLAERGMTQQELAARTGVTSAFVSKVINGKKGISGNFAYALECAFGVPKTFWLNLQANYEAELLDARECATITDEEKSIAQGMLDSIQELRENGDIMPEQKEEDIIPQLRRKFHVSNLAYLGRLQRQGVAGQPQIRIYSKFLNDIHLTFAKIEASEESHWSRKEREAWQKNSGGCPSGCRALKSCGRRNSCMWIRPAMSTGWHIAGGSISSAVPGVLAKVCSCLP